jgi:hypothetical protein
MTIITFFEKIAKNARLFELEARQGTGKRGYEI